MADIQRYLDGIESQHQLRPKYMAYVKKLLEDVDASTGIISDMPLSFYAQSATGAQLDIIGRIVGVDRRFPPVSIPGLPPLLDDDTFRQVILSRIVQNQWDGSNEKYREMWDATLGGVLSATYYDNQDMTMDVHIVGQTKPTMIEMILRGYIIPKPMGVGVSVNVAEEARTDTNRAYPESVSTLISYDSAEITIRYPNEDRESAPQLEEATLFPANNALIVLKYPVEDQEAQPQLGQSFLFPANSAQITIRAV